MHVAKPNFAATIHFTVGIKKSAAITKIEELGVAKYEESPDYEIVELKPVAA